MARGGPRAGSGRKQGSATKRTREIADKAAAFGVTPLEVMLKAMQMHCDGNRWDKAAAIAKNAAPYMHPRLASMEHSGEDGNPIKSESIIYSGILAEQDKNA